MSDHKTSKRNHKILICAAAILAIAVIGCCLAVFYFRLPLFGLNKPTQNDSHNINYDAPTEDQKKAGENIKKSTIDNTDKQKSGDFSVSFTSVSQTDNYLRIRSLITAVSNTGICTLVLTKGDSTITNTSDIQAGPSSSTCQGFDVLISELSSGNWQAVLTVEINGSSSEITRSITVQ